MNILLTRVLAFGICCTTVALPVYASKAHRADYVVVGMGAAGAEVAKLLSDDRNISVIGLEAGKNQDDDAPIKDSTSI